MSEYPDGPLPSNLVEQWQRFFVECLQRPLMMDRSTRVFETDLFPLQRKKELVKMLNLADQIEPKTVMSIGCDKGGELYHWCQFIPSVERIIACEVRGTPYASLFETTFPKIKFLWLARSSLEQSTKSEVRRFLMEAILPSGEVLGSRIDVLFIDGDKSFFFEDFLTWLPMMSPRGIVFMHDITDQAPGEAYRKIQRGEAGRDFATFDLLDSTESMAFLSKEPANGHEQWLKHWAGRSCGVGCILMPDCPLVR